MLREERLKSALHRWLSLPPEICCTGELSASILRSRGGGWGGCVVLCTRSKLCGRHAGWPCDHSSDCRNSRPISPSSLYNTQLDHGWWSVSAYVLPFISSSSEKRPNPGVIYYWASICCLLWGRVPQFHSPLCVEEFPTFILEWLTLMVQFPWLKILSVTGNVSDFLIIN